MAVALVGSIVTIFTSNDNGLTWTQNTTTANSATNPGIGWVSPNLQQRYFISGGRFSRSLNSGATWEDFSLSSGTALAWYAFVENSPLTIYGIHTATANGSTIIRRSTNGSLPSTNIATITGFVAQFIACDPTGTKLLVSGQGRTFRSLNSGVTWVEITSNLPAITSVNAFNFQMVE